MEKYFSETISGSIGGIPSKELFLLFSANDQFGVCRRLIL